jgi:hypothetical protein
MSSDTVCAEKVASQGTKGTADLLHIRFTDGVLAASAIRLSRFEMTMGFSPVVLLMVSWSS